MKKYFYYSLLLALSFVFLSCGDDDNGDDPGSQNFTEDITLKYSYNDLTTGEDGYMLGGASSGLKYLFKDVVSYEVIEVVELIKDRPAILSHSSKELYMSVANKRYFNVTFVFDITREHYDEITLGNQMSLEEKLAPFVSVTVRLTLKPGAEKY